MLLLGVVCLFVCFTGGQGVEGDCLLTKRERGKDPPSATCETKDLTYGSKKNVEKANWQLNYSHSPKKYG